MRLLALPGLSMFGASAPRRIAAPGRAVFLLIAITFALRLVWGATLEPTNDEAYHFLYTTHPDLSYFDHPPMTMVVTKIGILVCGGWVHPFSLRLGFTLLFAGSTWVMYRLTARWYGPWAGFYAALFLNLTAYYAAAGGFVLPDGPFLFFFLLTIWALGVAVVAKPGRTWPWVWVGLGLAGALLSKYHAIFLPAGVVLYALVTPGARRLLWSRGPYLALIIGSVGFTPVLAWNAQNGWASFVFQGGRALGQGFRPEGLLAVGLGPIAYLCPWVWGLLVWTLFTRLRRFRSIEGMDRLAVCLSIVPMAFFVAVGGTQRILPHWPLIGFVCLMPLLGEAWAKWAAIDPVWSRRRIALMAAAVLGAGTAVAVQARFGLLDFPGRDPLIEVSGWESVGEELEARGLTTEPRTFLFTGCWFDSGQLAFAVRERAPVLCYNAADARGFAYWSRPEQWVGWNGLYVTTANQPWELQMLQSFFRVVEIEAEFPMTRGGNPFRTVYVYRCIEQLRPFPFAYEKPPH